LQIGVAGTVKVFRITDSLAFTVPSKVADKVREKYGTLLGRTLYVSEKENGILNYSLEPTPDYKWKRKTILQVTVRNKPYYALTLPAEWCRKHRINTETYLLVSWDGEKITVYPIKE